MLTVSMRVSPEVKETHTAGHRPSQIDPLQTVVGSLTGNLHSSNAFRAEHVGQLAMNQDEIAVVPAPTIRVSPQPRSTRDSQICPIVTEGSNRSLYVLPKSPTVRLRTRDDSQIVFPH
jgi:hypothetical protein